jgi:hypothetical protein
MYLILKILKLLKNGKVHFTPLMYPPIGNLTPNVQFLVDDPSEVVSVCHREPSVHMPVILDKNCVTCSARSRLTQFPSPNYPRHHLTHTYHCLVPLQNITFKICSPLDFTLPLKRKKATKKVTSISQFWSPLDTDILLTKPKRQVNVFFIHFFCDFYIV